MRFCCSAHPASRQGERVRRLNGERLENVLWNHCSFDLVLPRTLALVAAKMLRQTGHPHSG
jgi:hypothetical protein